MSFPDRKMPATDARIGNYLLVMSGSIQSAPFLSCWKDLKDHIRKHIRRPGHTYVSSASEAGIHRGWCNFRREDDAKAAYEHYFKMPQVGVCLLKRAQCGTYHLLYYNCSVPSPAASQCSHAPCGVRRDAYGVPHNITFLPHQSVGTLETSCQNQLAPQAYNFQLVGLYVPVAVMSVTIGIPNVPSNPTN